MERYLKNRHRIRSLLKSLMILGTIITLVICLGYLLIPTPSTAKDTTKLVSLTSLFCVPISLSNAYNQFKIMKQEKMMFFDILQSVLCLSATLICIITILYINIAGTAKVDVDSMLNKAAAANLSIILAQWILFRL